MAGRASRMLRSGTRLCPPDRTFALALVLREQRARLGERRRRGVVEDGRFHERSGARRRDHPWGASTRRQAGGIEHVTVSSASARPLVVSQFGNAPESRCAASGLRSVSPAGGSGIAPTVAGSVTPSAYCPPVPRCLAHTRGAAPEAIPDPPAGDPLQQTTIDWRPNCAACRIRSCMKIQLRTQQAGRVERDGFRGAAPRVCAETERHRRRLSAVRCHRPGDRAAPTHPPRMPPLPIAPPRGNQTEALTAFESSPAVSCQGTHGMQKESQWIWS